MNNIKYISIGFEIEEKAWTDTKKQVYQTVIEGAWWSNEVEMADMALREIRRQIEWNINQYIHE